MTIAELSIKRPVFVTCLFTLILVVGGLSLSRLGVDLFPDVTFPIVGITTQYPGASPQEVESDVSKIMEDEIGSISGLENLYSNNKDGVSIITAQFTLETDIKYAQQQVRDKISAIRSLLPDDIKEPVIRIADPSDTPVLVVAVEADLPDAEMYELVEYTIKQKLEQADNVGHVDIIGGRKREFHVDLDKNKLKRMEISASMVSNQVGLAGKNVPSGTVQGDVGVKDATIRSLAEFKDLVDLENTIVNFVGNDVPVTVKDVGTVSESLVDEDSRSFINGKKSLVVQVYKQTDTNTVEVVKSAKEKVEELNQLLKGMEGSPKITVVQDNSWPIIANVNDVRDTILLGILLTVLVVYLALGSGRSTIITSAALPDSLLGAFILMFVAGFTVNVITLLALSLAVGLLIDDAIVVRENIFRHLEMGETPKEAARKGTEEVTMAVVATTLVMISVFAPVSFLTGVVGRFFKSFGLTVCFAMAISLLDALTMGPMLSAYFAGKKEHKERHNWVLRKFSEWQDWLEKFYERALRYTLRHTRQILLISLAVFFVSISTVIWIPKMFKQAPDNGEFMIFMKAEPGTSLAQSEKYAMEIDGLTRKHKEVLMTNIAIGGGTDDPNDISIYVKLVPANKRHIKTSAFKDVLRKEFQPYTYLQPILSDTVGNFGSKQPFLLYVRGDDLDELNRISDRLLAKFKDHPALQDVITSVETGKPEFDIVLDKRKTERLGVSNNMAGLELRTFVEGQTPAKFKVNDNNYDVRVRLQPDQRDLRKNYSELYVPNINNRLIPLPLISTPLETTGPTEIDRLNRARYIMISSDINPKGPGMGKAMNDIHKYFASKEGKLPSGYNYTFEGQAKTFNELITSMIIAAGIGIIFVYLILASLYESFVIPFTIMLVLPLAICGAFLALFLTGQSLDMFSMIGCIMLLGVATKNSIILVDYTHRLIDEGMERSEAIITAGKTRLRPILMTSFALIAGMAPLALGISELSSFRRSMGVAVTGGVISSTILSLIVIPAMFTYLDRFRVWLENFAQSKFYQK